MAIGTLAVNVVANTTRGNANLQKLASTVRVVGRTGEEAAGSIGLVGKTLKTIGSARVAGAAGKSLMLVAKSIRAADAGSKALKPNLISVTNTLGRMAAIGGGAGAAVAAVGAVAVYAGIKRVRHALRGMPEMIERIDSVARQSDKLGIGSQTLAGLRLAGRSVGVGDAKFDVAFEKMNIRIAEAARGTGEAVKTLEELGLDPNRLNRIAPEAKLGQIAKAMSKVGNQSDRLRIAGKLFEEEGTSMVAVLDLGVNKLKAFNAEAGKRGLAPSRRDVNQVREYTSAVNAAADAWQSVDDKLRKPFVRPKTWWQQTKAGAGNLASRALSGPYNIGLDIQNAVVGSHRAMQGRPSDSVGKWLREEAHARRMQHKFAQRRAKIAANKAGEGMFLSRMAQAGRDSFPMANYRHRKGQEQMTRLISEHVTPIGMKIGKLINDAEFGLARFATRAQASINAGVNPLTGRKMLGKSAAREALEARRKYGVRSPVDRVNTLVDANSAEGYLALRANRRGARDGETGMDAKKTAKATAETATATDQAAQTLKRIEAFFTRAPAPASA